MIADFDTFFIDAIQLKDSWKICDLCVANEDRFKRYFPKTLEANLTPTLAEYFAQKKVKAFANREEFLFTIKHKETRNIAGLVYIKELDWNKKQGEFAYCIDYNYEGQGMITKAVNALSNYAFETLKLETLQIIVHKGNIASVKVAANNNFKWTKTLDKAYTPPNEDPLDMELYELKNMI